MINNLKFTPLVDKAKAENPFKPCICIREHRFCHNLTFIYSHHRWKYLFKNL